MGRVSLCLVIMFFICSAQKIDAQVQNIREKQDTISATKSLEHIRPENIKKGPLNNALDVLSGQSAGVNVTTNGTDRLAMLNSIRVRGTTSIMGGNDPLVIIDGVTSDIATLFYHISRRHREFHYFEECYRNGNVRFPWCFRCN